MYAEAFVHINIVDLTAENLVGLGAERVAYYIVQCLESGTTDLFYAGVHPAKIGDAGYKHIVAAAQKPFDMAQINLHGQAPLVNGVFAALCEKLFVRVRAEYHFAAQRAENVRHNSP